MTTMNIMRWYSPADVMDRAGAMWALIGRCRFGRPTGGGGIVGGSWIWNSGPKCDREVGFRLLAASHRRGRIEDKDDSYFSTARECYDDRGRRVWRGSHESLCDYSSCSSDCRVQSCLGTGYNS